MERYKIGQLSKSMGVSTHLLKHYEKFNLVSPMKDDSTNYRYYDIRQCARIIESKRYRNMGFALKDIDEILNRCSGSQVDEMLAVQIDELEECIKQLKRQKYLAEKYHEECMDIEKRLGKWYIVDMDDYYYIDQTDNGALIEGGELGQEDGNLLEYAPIVKSVLRLEKECFIQDGLKYHWGLGLWGRDMEFVEEKYEFQKQMQCITGGRAFCTYLKLEVPYIDTRQIIDSIKEKYGEFEYSLTRDVFAIRIKHSIEEEKIYHYCAVYVALDES